MQYDNAHLERVHDAVVQHLKYVKSGEKPFLFVFDDCDMLVGDEGRIEAEEKEQSQSQSQSQQQLGSPVAASASSSAPAAHSSSSNSAHTRRAFRQYISSFLDDTPSHILITADISPGSIDGHTLRVHTLSGLHALDLVALFVNRLPRDIKPDDLRLHLKKVTNLNDLMQHPIFALMHGLPRMAEWCAELLNYTNMDQLYNMLNRQPLLNADKRRVVNNPHWPQQLPEEAKLLLRRCQALMLNKALSADRKKGRQSHDTQQTAAAGPTLSLSLTSGATSASNSHTADGTASTTYTYNPAVSSSSGVLLHGATELSGGVGSTTQSFDEVADSAVDTSGGSNSNSSGGNSATASASGGLLWLPAVDSSALSLSPSAAGGVCSPLLPLPPGVSPTVILHSPNSAHASENDSASPEPSADQLSASTATTVYSSASRSSSSDSSNSHSSGSSSSNARAAFSSVLPPLPLTGSALPLASSTSPSAVSSSLPLPLPFSPSAGVLSSSSASSSTALLSSVGRRSSSSSFTPLHATSVSFARRDSP